VEVYLDKVAFQSSQVVIAANSSFPEVTIREIGLMLSRRRAIIYTSVGTFLLLAILALIVSTRRYRSVGEIEIQKDTRSSLGLQTDSVDAPSDALEVNMLIQTQAKILQSDSLALRVIEDLHLEQTEDYRAKWSPIGWVFGLFSPQGAPDPRGASLENSPHRRMRVLGIFHRKLTVKPVAGTRLIDVEYLSPDPQLAAAQGSGTVQSSGICALVHPLSGGDGEGYGGEDRGIYGNDQLRLGRYYSDEPGTI
jgi:succinoglycan biosynthesis transport protein ExoP